jgi:hypothetical protein
MDAYHYHVKFEKEIKQDVDQGHFITAFMIEEQREIDRLKNSRQIKRVTSKVTSEVAEVVYKRMLDWYKADYNTLLLTGTKETFKRRVYNLVSGNCFAAVWCYTLAFLHSTEV